MVLLLLFSFCTISSISSTVAITDGSFNEPIIKNYVTHGPIYIDYDDNFTTPYGFPGSGTPGDPYRIEGYNITVSGDYPILFSGNNTKHFVIQNCFLKTDTNTGIYLGKYYEMGEGTVKVLNNRIISDNSMGINLNGGNNSLISGNTITSNDIGIQAINSYYSTFSMNIIDGLNDNGMYLNDSPGATISRNNCTGNLEGISLWFCSDSILTYNNCSYNTYGMLTTNLENLIVTNNIITDNTGYGYLLQNTDGSVLTNNLLQDNGNYGINVDLHSDDNILHHNAFINSLGATSQANDDGANNVWYDTSTNQGSYYSDWSGSGSYSIDGMASSVDPYPLNAMPVISEYSGSFLAPLMLLGFLALTLITFKPRNKKE